ncbi:hypothetical protein GE061_009832 [Apolygus lucorum]|uniref:Uncharacterized protein n=1 Tax=Apolygus lucorum TaxID=248454 RepID=A0A6A4KHE4_APOLU|nr:hypothetical protein GE061_009832 [Apolygus lucorum]
MAFHLMVCCLVCVTILCVCHSADCAPSAPSWPPHPSPLEPTNTCNTSSEVLKLCQRCAVKSQSKIVYPLCCDGMEEAREWCNEYLNFGVHYSPS